MSKWNYESKEYSSTGYEDIFDILDGYTRERYNKATKQQREEIVEEVFKIYRERDIFPIQYYSEEGVREEILKAIEYEPSIEDNIIKGNGFTSVCTFFFPNFYDAYIIYGMSGGNYQSGRYKFYNDEFFRRVIRFAIKSGGNARPKEILAGIRMVGSLPSNFNPMRAKAIYERYCPANGIIWDYCSGYGGRLLGCLSSKKNFTYIGTEPNSETYDNLIRFGNTIESVTGRENSFRIIKRGSEAVKFNDEVFDFAFSSPPYFNLEHYSDESTQCYIKFPDIYSWIDGYVKGTIHNIYKYLRHKSYYAVNIADFVNKDGKTVNYVDIWKDLSIKEGFEFREEIYFKMSVPCGNGDRKSSKQERVMVFYKE